MDTSQIKSPVYDNADFPLLIFQGDSGVRPSGWHEDLEIKINRSDKLYITLDSEILCGNKDEIFFINPYQIHTSPNTLGGKNEYDLIMLSLDFFSITGVQSISLRKIFMEDHIRFNNHITNPFLTEILNKIIAIYHDAHNPHVRIMVQAYFMEFFSILLQEEISELSGNNSLDKARQFQTIAPALETIHKSYDRKITSEELAQKCNLTHSYFCRLFKKVMGVTPIEYQTETRLRLADILLKEGTHTVADIAHTIGFVDENYFSRCYKKYRGISPSRIQKNKCNTPV